MAVSQENGPGQAVDRRDAGFHPTVWGDYFLRYDPVSNITDSVRETAEGTIQNLIPKVKEMLTSEAGDVLEKLELIDQVQRLCIACHFQKEVDEQLSKLHDVYLDFVNDRISGCEQLHMTALFFRLLRQQGYNISSEVFNKFKDTNGKFGEAVVGEVRGMLSLYEASHMMIHGEEILEEALTFTTVNLKLVDQEQHSPCLVNLVKQALKQPLRKGLPRLEAWHYIKTYQSDPSHNQVLLSLAKLDFNSLQKIHQKEASEIVRWWKDWDFSTKMSFARDRVVECYFWALGIYFEPEFAFARKFLAKIIALTSILDDMYDTYGTPEELKAYTEAIQKWDDVLMESLPDYMQLHYRALLAVYREAEMELAGRGELYHLPYAIQSMKDQAAAYLAEAKWFFQNYTPMLDEYMVLASFTSAHPLLITNSFVGMGDMATEEAFKWLSGNPQMLKGSSIICRLTADIVGHKFEQKRGHVASAIQCYIKQYGGTEQEAEEEMKKRVFHAWKDINEAMLQPFAVPKPVLVRILNFTRLIDVVYKDGDNYTHSGASSVICWSIPRWTDPDPDPPIRNLVKMIVMIQLKVSVIIKSHLIYLLFQISKFGFII